MLRDFLQNQKPLLSLHVDIAQEKKIINFPPVGYESQWINAPASCQLEEEFWGAFYGDPQNHICPPQLNKITLLDFLPSLCHLLSSSLCFLGLFSPNYQNPGLCLRLCHWRHPTKALHQLENGGFFCSSEYDTTLSSDQCGLRDKEIFLMLPGNVIFQHNRGAANRINCYFCCDLQHFICTFTTHFLNCNTITC